MNETTPAEKVAATPVTVERIVRLLTEADSDPWHDREVERLRAALEAAQADQGGGASDA